MRKTLIAMICLLLLAQPAFAGDVEDIKQLVTDKIAVVIHTIKQKDLDKQTRNQKIIDAVLPFFDFDQMAKLSLGKAAWIQMTPDQRKEFIDLFVKRLQESYVEKLELYTDEVVKVDKAERVGKRIHVTALLISKNDKMDMVFKFYHAQKGWLVYDIEIMGVSIVQTYRSQFAGVLKNGSIEDLLENLRKTGAISIKAPAK